EAPSNPTAAWWLVNPGDPGRTKGATMLSRVKKVALGVAAVSGAAVGGAAVAGAATSHSGTTTTPAATAHPPPGLKNMPAPGTAGGRRRGLGWRTTAVRIRELIPTRDASQEAAGPASSAA